jgi:hypothetical protein
MAGAAGNKNGNRRRPRRRTILNLGMPFLAVDDAVNQAEDAVATGFDVLEKVVQEIQEGYKLAKAYNEKQRGAEKAGAPRPPLPWLEVAARGRALQDVTLEAMRKGNEILLDSTRSGMNAAMSFVEALANARTDVDERPRLAGPVFDSLTVKAAPGQPINQSWPIRNRGLARLRIHVKAEPLHYLERAAEAGTHDEADEGQPAGFVRRGKTKVAPLSVTDVRFEPEGPGEEISVLTVLIDPIPANQLPGTYEGSITADNFDLFIGQLRVEVAKTAYSSAKRSRKTHATRRARG